jgi:hypothetical protein
MKKYFPSNVSPFRVKADKAENTKGEKWKKVLLCLRRSLSEKSIGSAIVRS